MTGFPNLRAKLTRINEDMEKQRLHDLPDELIMKIFSKLMPDVTLEDNNDESLNTCTRLIYESLLSNDAQTLGRLHLKLIRNYSASDINSWVQTAVNRYVRKLRFDLFGGTLKLPKCLRTCTTLKSLILSDVKIIDIPPRFRLPSLKSLHLFSVEFPYRIDTIVSLLQCCPNLEFLVLNRINYENISKDAWRGFCLSSLKSLHILSLRYFCDKSIANLLENCPVLEYLVVNQTKCDKRMFSIIPDRSSCLSSLKVLHLLSVTFWSDKAVAMLLETCTALEDLVISRTKNDNVRFFAINVPTLKSLSINNSREESAFNKGNHGFWIKAPALEKLDFKDKFSNYLIFEYMPEVIKANIEVICDQSEKFIGSLNMIQHLSLCSLASETPYPRGTFFPYLEHLELCTCSAGWANLLAYILNDAPRIRSLKLESKHSARKCYEFRIDLWNEPTGVPECLSTNLEILEWRQYEGTEQERTVAAYILANATYLKMATFSTRCRDKYAELKKMSRVSETCRLVCE